MSSISGGATRRSDPTLRLLRQAQEATEKVYAREEDQLKGKLHEFARGLAADAEGYGSDPETADKARSLAIASLNILSIIHQIEMEEES